MSTRLLRPIVRAGACVAVFIVCVAAPSSAGTAPPPPVDSQTVNVTRPDGHVVLTDIAIDGNGHLQVTLVDTRADDPGWSVTVSGDTAGWTPEVDDQTESFTDASGHSYEQHVTAGSPTSSTLASAPSGHGLGIAHLGARMASAPGSVITVTVI